MADNHLGLTQHKNGQTHHQNGNGGGQAKKGGRHQRPGGPKVTHESGFVGAAGGGGGQRSGRPTNRGPKNRPKTGFKGPRPKKPSGME